MGMCMGYKSVLGHTPHPVAVSQRVFLLSCHISAVQRRRREHSDVHLSHVILGATHYSDVYSRNMTRGGIQSGLT